MKRLCSRCLYTAICFFVLTITGWAQKSVVMQHADLNRTGWYNQETSLTVNNVKPGSFGKIFERIVDDQVYAQPLIILNINIPAVGNKNILLVATVNNTVYAFDV